jgi:hypothetical protein
MSKRKGRFAIAVMILVVVPVFSTLFLIALWMGVATFTHGLSEMQPMSDVDLNAGPDEVLELFTGALVTIGSLVGLFATAGVYRFSVRLDDLIRQPDRDSDS